MHPAAPFFHPRFSLPLVAGAVALFAAGLAIFVAQRPGLLGLTPVQGLAQWLQAWPTLRGSLPSFAHTYALVLLACLWLARSARQALAIGALLGAVDLAMELLQHRLLHARAHTPEALRAWLASTFDINDVVAIVLGLAAAVASLAWARQRTRALEVTA